MITTKKDWFDQPNNYNLYNEVFKRNITYCTKKKDGAMSATDFDSIPFYEMIEVLEDLNCSNIEKRGFNHIEFCPPCDRRMKISLHIYLDKRKNEFVANRLYSYKSYKRFYTRETLYDEIKIMLDKIEAGEICIAPKEKWGDLNEALYGK